MDFRRVALATNFVWLTFALSAGADYYVALNGNDDIPGSRERLFRTLQRAVDRLAPGDRCIVRGGVYRQTVRIERSGTSDAPITIMAFPGERVVLSGTEAVPGPWERFKGKIFKTRLERPVHQVFVDGVAMTEARWPNMPFERRWDRSVWRPSASGTRYGLMVDPELAQTGIDWTGAIATLNIGSWQTFRRPVSRHGRGSDRFTYPTDPQSRLAREKPHRPGFDRYFLSGKLEALDSPGEWFLDKKTHTLYLWTPDGRTPAAHRVEAKVRAYAVAARGVSHVVLSGFHFFATTFKVENASHCRIEGVHLLFPHGLFDPLGPPQGRERHPDEPTEWASRRWFGETSVVTPTYLGGTKNTLAWSSIAYTNGAALVVHGSENTIENCLFHDIDWYGLDTGLALDLLGSPRTTVRYCTLYNFGSSEGIRLSNRAPSLIEFNYIHDGGRCQSDGALIQMGTPRIAGTVVRYNWVHDHNAFNWGGNGIRGDDRTRGIIVHHNVAWRCRNKGIIAKGDGNKVCNNTCLDNPAYDILVPRNRLPGKVRELTEQNRNSEVINNCARRISGTYRFERPQLPPACKVAANYTGPAPMLVDPAKFDFRPRRGSPLIDAGLVIPGITDGYLGKAPDIGAYEFGAPRWVPGHRNALWVLPGERGLRVALAMPPAGDLTVEFSVRGEKGAEARLIFTEREWWRPRDLPIAPRSAPLGATVQQTGERLSIEVPERVPFAGLRFPFRSLP